MDAFLGGFQLSKAFPLIWQNQWGWIVPHQISLSIVFVTFLLDLMLLPIGASFTNQFRIIRYIYAWLEVDDEEITTLELFRSYITSAIFAGSLFKMNWVLRPSVNHFNFSVLSGCALHSLSVNSCSRGQIWKTWTNKEKSEFWNELFNQTLIDRSLALFIQPTKLFNVTSK